MATKNSNFSKIILLTSYILFSICIISLSSNIVNSNSNNENWILQYVIVSLIQISMSIIYIKKSGEELFSLSIVFIILTYIFNFGQLFMYAFKIKNNSDYDVVGWIPLEILNKACMFTSVSITFITLGIIIVWAKNKKMNIICDDIINKINLKNTFRTGLVLFCIGILPKFYIEFSKLQLHSTGGYLDTYEVLSFNGGGVLSTFANMSEYGICMLLIGLQEKKKVCKLLFLSSLFFEIITMFSGNRARATMSILMYLYIYVKLIKKISMKDIIIFLFYGYIGLSFLTFISRIRMQFNVNFATLLNDFTYSFFQHSPIFDALAEFGSTMLTLCYSILIFPQYGKPTYGTNYLFSLLNAIPNINGILEGFRNSFEYTNLFKLYFKHPMALGGSFLGELYYNFNYLGPFFAIVIGFIVGYVSKNINYSIKRKDWIRLSIFMILFPNILWLVRNYFSSIPRDFIWTSMVILIISFFVKKEKKLLYSVTHKME
ncbi:O-antigen polysaccharide polymerase Wzy [Clostridium estertheticum]|uniref:O-antigen polysaccharide polymerase Wzy n=1 Tax=Clostridium estertheticum TaxID=238834 RepID=UPI001C7D4E79|nr:O-antigen polysaccharide polymerase Wzy [Clostridium estertheticum]MBX4270561.1 O-antigen polysaccharide polymerase Wzy family protein [Clostridium estertheticum]WLC80087.1 O-antigen polysaccharide polymerase Wzy family protein [Clostridium estertheticum]